MIIDQIAIKSSNEKKKFKNKSQNQSNQIQTYNTQQKYKASNIFFQSKNNKQMRILTDEETKVFFTKLSEYIGPNIKFLIDRTDEPHVFRLVKDRVYYMSETILKQAQNIGREQLMHAGTCFGKFTQGGKFRLSITCLDYLAKFAKNKIWLKPQGEQAYCYGNHVIKAHVGRMTENIVQYAGIVIFSMNDMPLGFGIAAKSTLQAKDMDPTGVIAFNQSDIGEYLRNEDEERSAAQQNKQ